MVNTQSEYRTKDLAEASFLLTKSIKFLRIDREGRVCWFIFDDASICENLIAEYWFRNATVPAKTFYEAVQTLKNRIFSSR